VTTSGEGLKILNIFLVTGFKSGFGWSLCDG
jgi:hypothetical protein